MIEGREQLKHDGGQKAVSKFTGVRAWSGFAGFMDGHTKAGDSTKSR